MRERKQKLMELNEELNNDRNISETWENHINKKMQENLKNAIKRKIDEALDEIEIDDMGAIDSIEDGIVKCELLNREYDRN